MLLTLVLTACGQPKLNTSSHEKKKESLQIMVNQLPDKTDQERLKATIAALYVPVILSKIVSEEKADKMEKKINLLLDGKTADEIFKLAETLKKQKNK